VRGLGFDFTGTFPQLAIIGITPLKMNATTCFDTSLAAWLATEKRAP
jgi:hypothetical protein